nr:serine protease [Actinomycetota bacterium]
TAGLGVLVGTRQVVTCAHVVNTSLGRDQREQARPDPSAVVQVEFPLLPGAPVRTGRVQAWVPPPQRGEGEGDVAGLVLSEDAPTGATPARFAVQATAPGSRLRVFGYPETPPRERGGWVDVDLKGDVGGQLMQVESRTDQTIKAQPGYSGSPVWQHGTGLVLGLLHAAPFADEPYRDAYLLPAILVAEAWEEQFDYLLVAENPYRGLESFTAEQAEVFFGRDQDIDLLASRVLGQPVVVIVGPSGVGKSSLVQAGLVPRLREAGRWSVVLVRPGQDPWQRLAAGLLRAQHGIDEVVTAPESRDEVERTVERLRGEGLGPLARFLRSMDRPLLVVVDQFEELLATGQPPDPQLLDLLLPPHDAADDPSRVAITLRADYLPALLAVPGIGPRLNQRLYMLSPLTEDQLRAVVERPATACQVGFDAGLVDQIVRDAGAGSLPLLQFTLTRLWETQQRKRLSFVGYYGIGGVSGALDRFAEQQMSMLPDNAAGVVDRVLLRLVRTPAGDPGLTTRQRAYQSDLPPAEWEVARRLAVARLVIVDTDSDRGPYAELAHEALISSWRRLRRLVGDNADFLGWLAWVQQRAAEGDPLPEARIAEARRWVQTRPDAIPDQVHAFIDSSQTAVEARLHELSQARNRAEALRLAADAELALRSGQARTTVALALGAESLLTEPTAQGELALRHVLRLHPRTIARLDHDDAVWA